MINEVIFPTENNEYKIKLTKKKKLFIPEGNKYGQYDCLIEFLDAMNFPVVSIKCNEVDIYNAALRISELGNYIMYSTSSLQTFSTIQFNNTGDLRNFFWLIGVIDDIETLVDYPVEEEPMWYLSVYSTSMGMNSMRLYIQMSYSFIDIFTYNLFTLVEELDYLDELNNTLIRNYVEGELYR